MRQRSNRSPETPVPRYAREHPGIAGVFFLTRCHPSRCCAGLNVAKIGLPTTFFSAEILHTEIDGLPDKPGTRRDAPVIATATALQTTITRRPVASQPHLPPQTMARAPAPARIVHWAAGHPRHRRHPDFRRLHHDCHVAHGKPATPASRPAKPACEPATRLLLVSRQLCARHIEQISAETKPWQCYCTLDRGICEYRWNRRRLYVVVDTRGDMITRVRMSTRPRQPGTLVTVWDEADRAAPKPT